MPASLTAPRVRFELATRADDAALRALFRETPMEGSIEVAFHREPSFLTAASVLGQSVQVLAAREGEQVVGVATRAIRESFVNGQLIQAGYLSDLRLRPESRGGTALVRGYRFLRELHGDGRARIYSTVIVEDNRRALGTIAANRAGLPRYTDLGRIHSPLITARRRLPPIEADIVRGTPELLPDILAKLNENRLQFAPAYAPSDFLDGRLRGFRIEDFYVLRRNGRIAGVLGAWDQGSFRQTVIVRYRGLVKLMRPALSRFLGAPLPEPGSPLRFLTVSFLSTDDDAAFRALLRRVYRDAREGPVPRLVVALHERDSRASILREYPATSFPGRLFAVTFEGPPDLDDRVPYVDAGLL